MDSHSEPSDAGAAATIGQRAWPDFVLAITAIAIVGGFYFWRLWLIQTAWIDFDELEHLHAAWYVSRGYLPFRDFFEHHTPWLYFLLAPFFRFYAVATDPDQAIAFIFLARKISMILAGIALVLTFTIARRWRGNRVAMVSVVLLSSITVFIHKTLEIRPDVPGFVLWMGCLAVLMVAVDAGASSGGRQKSLFAISGVLLGSDIMFEGKALAVMPFFTVAMLWYLLAGKAATRNRFVNCLCLFGGFCLPIAATCGFFWAYGGLGAMVKYTFVTNLRIFRVISGYRVKVSKRPAPGLFSRLFLWQVFAQNPVAMMGGVFGLAYLAPPTFRKLNFTTDKLLFLNTIGPIAGIRLLGNPWPQYYLTFIPLLTIYAGALLVSIVDGISGTSGRSYRWVCLMVLVLLSSCAIVMPWSLGPLSIVVAYLVLIAIAATVAFRYPTAAIAVALIAFTLDPLRRTKHSFDPNARQLHQVRFVLEHTQPTDILMDGHSGLGVFRPHAYFFWIVDGVLLPMLTPADRQQLTQGLTSGRIAPKFIFLNGGLLAISQKMTAFIFENYRQVKDEAPILERRQEPPAAPP